jgi:ribonuclease I
MQQDTQQSWSAWQPVRDSLTGQASAACPLYELLQTIHRRHGTCVGAV